MDTAQSPSPVCPEPMARSGQPPGPGRVRGARSASLVPVAGLQAGAVTSLLAMPQSDPVSGPLASSIGHPSLPVEAGDSGASSLPAGTVACPLRSHRRLRASLFGGRAKPDSSSVSHGFFSPMASERLPSWELMHMVTRGGGSGDRRTLNSPRTMRQVDSVACQSVWHQNLASDALLALTAACHLPNLTTSMTSQ